MRAISVGFTIYEAQNLEAQDKALLDPLVIVRCCDKVYITKKKKKKYNAVNWEESHVWDRIMLSEIEWTVAKIEFEIQSANTFWRNDIIGVISFELKLIKNKKNHQIEGTYPVLYKNGTEIRGQLRLKVMVCDEKDYIANNDIFNNNLTQGNYKSISDDENFYADLTKAVVEENTICLRDDTTSRFYYLYVNIHKIEDIYIDGNKKKYRDLYITCEFNGCYLKSSQGRNCTNYTFNECFKIPIATPILEDSIVIKIWDWNFLSSDELLAIGVLSFNHIKNKAINPTWLNLYGFHKNEINLEKEENYKISNDFSLSLEGNAYLGRICISSYVERLNNFDNMNIAITQSCLAYDDPLYIPITLLCDVYLVTGVLAKCIYVELCCGPHSKRTDCVLGNEIENGEVTSSRKKTKNCRNSINRNGEDFLKLFRFDDLLNVDNFFSKFTDKQKILDRNENTEFHFSARQGKIENMKLCVVQDEMQQWDVLINVYEKVQNLHNEGLTNNFLYPSGGLEAITEDVSSYDKNGIYNQGDDDHHSGRKYSMLSDQKRYKVNKRKIHGMLKEESNSHRRIAYYRMPLKNVLLYNEKIARCPIWIPLKNIPRNMDTNLNCMYNIFQNGSILINLQKSYDIQMGINRRKNLIPVNYELRCYIYACRNIISHFNDSPNTFVHISCSGKMKITSLALNNSNPVFLQCLKLNVNILTDYSAGLPTIPLIVVTLYEFYNDTFYFIGRCFCNYDIYLKDNYKKCNFTERGSNYNVVQQIQPKWVKLKGSKHVRAMYPSMLWQQGGSDRRAMQEYLHEKQREIYNDSRGSAHGIDNLNGIGNRNHGREWMGDRLPKNDLLRGERVGDILLYFELVQEKDALKIPIYPMMTEIKKCTLSFFCMSLENLVLMKKQKFRDSMQKDSKNHHITHPMVLLSITSYSSYGKKNNELIIKYEKSLKANTRIQLKNWKNSFHQQSFEMFSIENLNIDVPLDPIFDPILNIKVYNKKIKEKYFIGETNISLVPYLPWIKNLDEVLYYLQAHDDYSETIDFKHIDSAFNIYKNKNAALVITAISLADCDHVRSLKQELSRYERDGDQQWSQTPPPAVSTAMCIGGMYNGGMYNGGMYNGGMYNGGMYNGGMYNGGMYNGGVYNGGMYNGGMYNGGMYNGGVYNGGMYNGGMNNGGMNNDWMYNGGMNNGGMNNGEMHSGGMYGSRMQHNDIHENGILDGGATADGSMGDRDNRMVISNMQKNNLNHPSNFGMVNCATYAGKSFERNRFEGNPFGGKRLEQNRSGAGVYKVRYNKSVYRLHEDGVPEMVKLSYNVKNYPYIKIIRSKFILNVYIPPRFILYVEGDKINIEKFVKNVHRVSVDGILENYLDDILIPSLPLKKKYNSFSTNGEKDVEESIVKKEGINFACFDKFPFIELLGGHIKCFTKIKYRHLESENIPLTLKEINNQNTFRNKFRGNNKIPLYLKIRVYVLRGIGIYGINKEGMANPYLIFSLGEKTTNLRNAYKECNMNPNFSCLWESEAIFPEDEILTISVYSAEDGYDKQINDIYIGSTEINLFDRWMSKEWRHMMKRNKIPIEYRPIYNNYFNKNGIINKDNLNSRRVNGWYNIFSFFDIFTYFMNPTDINIYTRAGWPNVESSEQGGILLKTPGRRNNGILEMWVEIMDYEQSKKIPIHKMVPPKKTDIEIRIIIWRCTMLSNEENINRTFDLTITGELDCITYHGKNSTVQTTDVHYNCKTGNAIFNWRMVYPYITYPLNTCFLQLAAYNNNNVGVSEFLGEVNLELSKYIQKASHIVNKFELDAELKLRKKKGNEPDNSYNGYIQVTVQFLPQTKANVKPVGLGRDEPNRNPYLRTPDSGRDWNDFVYSIGLNSIYKPFWGWLKIFFLCLLIIWVFVLSFVYPSLLL
ncbi:ferlin, putative [Plasmodium ovale curtisi]|uniref:Ferlin, putative n=1 Tax=Plasmodium ovale curtisi TaxID=864141 RepID=A0A1A8W4H7_PLAOA|nr:ferlin, putative [Plasmodium ovale curtisi]